MPKKDPLRVLKDAYDAAIKAGVVATNEYQAAKTLEKLKFRQLMEATEALDRAKHELLVAVLGSKNPRRAIEYLK